MRRFLRSLRPHRFGAAAPRLRVRAQAAWYWRALGLAALVTVSVAAGLWIYDEGRRYGGFHAGASVQELESLRQKFKELQAETATLRGIASTADNSLKIERTAQEKLAQQVKQLEAENGRLREDLAFFENLSAKDRSDDRVSVYRFKVENDVIPGEYRYWLLITQGGAREREFQGRLQFVVMLTQGGQEKTYTLPDDRPETANAYRVAFRRFYRAEGSFRVDPGAKVRGVQVKVFEQGTAQPRAFQSVVL
jgi:hypothetical protein